MENNYVAAVDLGTTKVVIAVAKRAEKNKIEIISIKEHESKGVVKGALRNIEQAHAAIVEVKNQIEEELDITLSNVFIGVSGHHINCVKTSGEIFITHKNDGYNEVTESDVERLTEGMYHTLLPAGNTIITVIPQNYKLDHDYITEPVGMEGRKLQANFNVIAGEDAPISAIKRCFSRAGLEVSGMTLQPIASACAVLDADDKELGVAVVDIGGGTTDLCIYHDKIIRHIAVSPIGGNEINSDIKSCGILDRHLEKLKVKFGEAMESKVEGDMAVAIDGIPGQKKEIPIRLLAKIIESRLDDIIEFVMKQIEKSELKDKLGGGIILTGGSSQLKNIEALFKERTGYTVRVAQPKYHLTPESAEKVAGPQYSAITGVLIDAIASGHSSTVETRDDNQSNDYGYDHPDGNDPGYHYEDNCDEEEDYPQDDTMTQIDRAPKRNIFTKAAGLFSKLFDSDELDSEDKY